MINVKNLILKGNPLTMFITHINKIKGYEIVSVMYASRGSFAKAVQVKARGPNCKKA